MQKLIILGIAALTISTNSMAKDTEFTLINNRPTDLEYSVQPRSTLWKGDIVKPGNRTKFKYNVDDGRGFYVGFNIYNGDNEAATIYNPQDLLSISQIKPRCGVYDDMTITVSSIDVQINTSCPRTAAEFKISGNLYLNAKENRRNHNQCHQEYSQDFTHTVCMWQ